MEFRNVPRAACPTLIFAPPWPKIKGQAHPCTVGESRNVSGQSPAHTGPSGHLSCPKTYGPPLAAGGPPQLDPGQRRPLLRSGGFLRSAATVGLAAASTEPIPLLLLLILLVTLQLNTYLHASKTLCNERETMKGRPALPCMRGRSTGRRVGESCRS